MGRMRRGRIKRREQAYYHCMTRVVGREMLLGEAEKIHLQNLIRRVEGFTGVRVLTYALMTNHFHLLLEEPDGGTVVSDDELGVRLRALYTDDEVGLIEGCWLLWEEQGNLSAVEADKARYKADMHDISSFMKRLKHRFSFWYNRRHGRKGTLWAERFKSVLVEGGEALRCVAAYIEMNPVRAGLVDESSDYVFCGFGEAVAGSVMARNGLARLSELLQSRYGWDESVGAVVIDRGRLLRRCRYFTDGQVLGGRAFVEGFFEENRTYFGPRRVSGGRMVRDGWECEGIFAVRDVRSRGSG
ncbi:MAG: transposase [Spartobacteria bacterium]|nr:transposase [Spartobacteria bacterium]